MRQGARIGRVVGGLQQRLREAAGNLRGTPGGAVRASWVAEWARGIGFSVAVAIFLSVVGAFGSIEAPFWPRTLFFAGVGLGCGVIVSGAIWISLLIPGLRSRPLMRRAAIGLMVTPAIAVFIWGVMGYAFLGGPKLGSLPEYLGYSLVMSIAMTALSWAVFRPRRVVVLTAPVEAAPKFLERLPLKLRGSELYAVQAEDHYLRLHTSKGSDLILMRLSDAISELEGLEGMQIHRSWWVARNAVVDVKRPAGRAVLTLKDGAEVPVSRTYARALRESGWI